MFTEILFFESGDEPVYPDIWSQNPGSKPGFTETIINLKTYENTYPASSLIKSVQELITSQIYIFWTGFF